MKLCDLERLSNNPFALFGTDWALVTAGREEKFNTMTISWGAMGVLWGKKVVIVFIRPQRYTRVFLEQEARFTVSFYGEDKREALTICGRESGRDGDKVKKAGLTPVIDGDEIYFAGAKLVLTCKKLYHGQFDPALFIQEGTAEQWYPEKDYHEVYIGEIEQAMEAE